MIGVCIKYFHKNYGGMLQAYATTALLEQRGIDYELVRYQKTRSVKTILCSLPRLLNRILLNDKYEALLKKVGMKLHPELAAKDAVRNECFDAFCDAHFTKLSPVFVGYPQLCEGARRYSAVITGSDQLWSPAGLPTNYYNLMFVPEDVRKISYASSFGVKEIPWYQKKRTAQYLNRMDHISMREYRGSQIVKELTGKEVPTVLDPVFLLDAGQWEELIPVHREMEEPYIFAYFLGEDPGCRTAVKEAARELGCKIVSIPHMDRFVPADEGFADLQLFDVDPARFLNLLRGASYVCTDSYHGTCFSILHKKQFVTFNRYQEKAKHSKNSRIDTLCEMLGLQNRRYVSGSALSAQLDALIDYSSTEEKLRVEKDAAERYIENAFSAVR